jgi:hypothetical protein
VTPVWWTISEERLLDLPRRAHAGEDPEALYITEYANADIENVAGGES